MWKGVCKLLVLLFCNRLVHRLWVESVHGTHNVLPMQEHCSCTVLQLSADWFPMHTC